jgi:hypothetical protein
LDSDPAAEQRRTQAEAELHMECIYHGDPVNPQRGSLVYQIPGWDLLNLARRAGHDRPVPLNLKAGAIGPP